MPKICQKCGKEFPLSIKIEGKKRILHGRKYCFDCSPFGLHNTKKIHVCSDTQERFGISKKCCKCKIIKSLDSFYFKIKENRYNSWCKDCVYSSQSKRWKDRKRKVVELFGGKCQECGYNKNLAAFHFHHLDPAIKEFSTIEMLRMSWEKLIKEMSKCILLCGNCHTELHWPEDNLDFIGNGKGNTNLDREFVRFKSTGECPLCHEEVFGTKYCSTECAANANRKVERPSKEILLSCLTNKESMCSIGRKYGVSDNSIRKWLKAYGLL